VGVHLVGRGSASISVENLQGICESLDCLRAEEINYFHT